MPGSIARASLRRETAFTQASEQEHFCSPLPLLLLLVFEACTCCGEGVKEGKIEDSGKQGAKYKKK